MRIAYILSSLANSGPIVVAYDLITMMVKHGHYVEVFYFDDKNELIFPCKTTKIAMTSKIDFSSFDIIHTHGVRPDLYVMFHKPLFCKTPTCTTIHGYRNAEHGFMQKMISNIGLLATYRDDKVILLSKHMMNFYGSYLPKDKLTYAYNSRKVDLSLDLTSDERKQVLNFKGNDILLCSVSRLDSNKALWQIIEAISSLEHVKYCVVGDGVEMASLKKLVKDSNISQKVLFVGRKPAGYRYLKYADIFVLPSYSEGFPLALLEAASMRKAVICSNLPIYDELFTKDEIVKFELENITSLQNAILKAIRDKQTLSEKIYTKFLNTYSSEQFYNRHIEIYKKLMADK